MTAIDLIKQQVSIIDVLGQYTGADFTKARTTRERFNIRCPFHYDKNPSFTVYTDTNTFRCWSGCNNGKPGDVIDIVCLACNVDTKEAVRVLLEDYGLKNQDSNELKEWQKKRAKQQELLTLSASMNLKITRTIHSLKQIELMTLDKLSEIKTFDDLEQIGELYHLLPQLDYWLDCLIDDDILIQFEALEEAEAFIRSYESMVMTA